MREFRVKCQECIDRFVFLILDNVTVTSGISRGLYSFCPEIMLEGDDQHVFGLFNSLCELFLTCNVLSPDELKAASAEYRSYVEERRRHHEKSTYAASEIQDVVQFLLRDFGFQFRTHILRLSKIYCLIVRTPDSNPSSVTIDLIGSTLNQVMVQNCVLIVQSHVLCSGFNPQFFSGSLLDAVQKLLRMQDVVFVGGDVDVLKNFRLSDVIDFVDRYKSLFRSYLLERRQSCEAYYLECN